MASIGVKLPITKNSADGFTMIKTIKGMVRQNLKMLVLTNPGERVMEPNFGVGVSAVLFENYSEGVQVEIEEKLRSQVKIYLPIIDIKGVRFQAEPDSAILKIQIGYFIPGLGVNDLLNVTI